MGEPSQKLPTGVPRGPLVITGQIVVPFGLELALRQLVAAFVGGAVGPGLRLTRRDRGGITFEAVTLGARLAGPTSGTVGVAHRDAETIAHYRLSLTTGLLFGGVVGGAAGGLTWLLGAPSWWLPVCVGVMVAGGWAAFVAHRTRVRFETMLHNLRYLS